MNKIMFLVSCTLFAFSCAPKYLTYEQFGAKGDGVSDDFPAIIATHAAANEMELPVKATNGKTYYIGNTTGTAIVRTDVDFGTAKFIIDDSNVSLENRGYNIFEVKSAIEPINIEGIENLKRDQANIDVTLPGRCLVRVVNDNHKAYIRLGANQDNGTAQEEYFIVDKDGNIDPTTSPIWDYSEIT